MKVTLTWPIGRHHPGEVIDCVPEVAAVLVREGFARPTDGPPVEAAPEPPTVAELRRFAADNGISTREARDRIAADHAARRQGVAP